MTEIKPGHKLDRAVARAIGRPDRKQCDFEMFIDGGYEGSVYRCNDCQDVIWDDGTDLRQVCDPEYSTDLNAAFRAAEKVDLFCLPGNTHGQGPWVSLARGPIGWLIMKDDIFLGRGGTPALAICAAILKLHEEKEASND